MIIQVKDLSGGYNYSPIIREISFEMYSGQVTCLLGPNGSGKTTLMKALMGFLPNVDGQILLDGQPVRHLSPQERARLIAYIPQMHVPVFDYTVFDIVLMGRASYLGPFNQPGKEDHFIAYKSLEQLGIQDLADRKYTKLSGGQRQLVLFARALCQQAKLLIMDEPSADLDFAHQQLIANTILQLKNMDLCILLSTHAPEMPFSVADQVLMLQQGKLLIKGSPDEVLTAQTLEQIYGVPMDVVSITDSNGNSRRLCLPL